MSAKLLSTQLNDEFKDVLLKSDIASFQEAMRALKEEAELVGEVDEDTPRYVHGEDYTVTEDLSQRVAPTVSESREFEDEDRDAIIQELEEGMEDIPGLSRLVKQALLRG